MEGRDRHLLTCVMKLRGATLKESTRNAKPLFQPVRAGLNGTAKSSGGVSGSEHILHQVVVVGPHWQVSFLQLQALQVQTDSRIISGQLSG